MTSDPPHEPPPEPPHDDAAAMPNAYKLFRSEELFQGERVICIQHAGSVYRLQITSRGKLILQK